MKMKAVAYLCLSLLFVSSCALEKRVHQSGFHIIKKSSYQKSQKQLSNSEFNTEENLVIAENNIENETQKNEESTLIIKKSANNNNAIAFTENNTAPTKTINKQKAINKETPTAQTKIKKSEKTSSTENIAMDSLSDQNVSKETSNNLLDDTMKILILILCFILPPVAVWLLTEDIGMLVISIILSILFWLPGIIFALFFFFKKY